MKVALDRLAAALSSAGLAPLQPADDDVGAALGDLDELLLPLFRLPDDVRRFWELVNPVSLGWMVPRPSDVEFATQGWSESVGIDMVPPALFPVCYQSHQWMYVELDDESEHGGCFLNEVGDDTYELVFRSLSDWVVAAAVAIETGAYDTHQNDKGVTGVLIDYDRWAQRARAGLSGEPDDGRYPAGLEIGSTVQHWPERWLVPFDLVPADIHASGSTHRLADLATEPPVNPFEVTVQARWRSVRNINSEQRAILELTDDSGQLRVDLPADIETFGQGVNGMRELDIMLYTEDQRQSRRTVGKDGTPDPATVGEITSVRFVQ